VGVEVIGIEIGVCKLKGWRKRGRDIPIYHPCTRKIRRKKTRSRTTVPTHRYVANGVLLSR